MVRDDKDRFINSFRSLKELFGKDISKEVQKIYTAALTPYSIEDVERAISVAMGTLKFFPKPVELIELIGGNSGDMAEVECVKAFKAIRSVGSYESVCFDDPITQAVIAQYFGGWVKFCMETEESTEHFRKKDFVKIYPSFKRSNMKHGGHLAGITETQNNANLAIKNPDSIRYVGDRDKCQRVLNLTTGKEHPGTGMIKMGLEPQYHITVGCLSRI